MDLERARREAEARRYRLQLRLALVERQARAEGDFELLDRALDLRREVDAVLAPRPGRPSDWRDVETASVALSSLRSKVRGLAMEAGVEENGRPLLTRWQKLSLGAVPVVFGLGLVAFIFARRRQKTQLDDEAIARLERGLDR